MAPPVTEVAYLTLKPGVDLHGSGAEAKAWSETMSTLQAQPGMQKIHYGRTIEEPNLLILFVDWDTLQAHKDFIAKPIYQPFTANLTPICDGLHLHHMLPSSFPPSVLGTAPVIEFATFLGVEAGFTSNVERFLAGAGSPEPEGFYGVAYGESVEDDVRKHAEQDGDGEGGEAMVLLIGWESKEKHMEFRESENFKENIHFLRTGAKGAEMFHVEKITTI